MMQSTGGVLPMRPVSTAGRRSPDYGIANGNAHKVDYVIWRQHINSIDGRGWRAMADRGSITQNHFDHVQ